jgi:hypothetical protein
VLLHGKRHDADGERQQARVTADHTPQEDGRAQKRVAGDVGADRVDERGRAGRERDRAQHDGREHAGGGTELAEHRPRGDEDATPDDEDRHEGHADVTAEQPHGRGQQIEVGGTEVIHVAGAAAVVPRRRRLADERGARRPDVERADAHERGIRGGRPLGHDPREREDRRQRERECKGERDPPAAPAQVAEPEDRAGGAVLPSTGRRLAPLVGRVVIRERKSVDGASVS